MSKPLYQRICDYSHFIFYSTDKIFTLYLYARICLQTISVNAADSENQTVGQPFLNGESEQINEPENQNSEEIADGPEDEDQASSSEENTPDKNQEIEEGDAEEVKEASKDLQEGDNSNDARGESQTGNEVSGTEAEIAAEEDKDINGDVIVEATQISNIQDFAYEIRNGIAIITGYTGTETKVMIPSLLMDI